jgi:hypothetical protein
MAAWTNAIGAQVVLDSEHSSAELRLCPPHHGGCPVIMKLDPEHVAWTCARCGLVALSDDLGVRPA